MTARNPLYGATFAITNASAFTVSGSVIMIVSVSLYTYQAEQLLSMLTHSSSNKRVGDNVTVSGSAVYLMHLPKDSLSLRVGQFELDLPFSQARSWNISLSFSPVSRRTRPSR